MKLSFKLQIKIVLMTLSTVVFFSCDDNFKEVQQSTFEEFAPSGEADSINIKYTDSGKIKSILISDKMRDYATVEFPFTEFPKGVKVTLYDEKGKKTFVTSEISIGFLRSGLSEPYFSIDSTYGILVKGIELTW